MKYLTKTLSNIPICFNNDSSLGGRIRKRYLTTFIPPSTKTPIFEYGGDEDQRSFLSMVSNGHFEDNSNEETELSTSFQSLPIDMTGISANKVLEELLTDNSRKSNSSSSSNNDSESDLTSLESFQDGNTFDSDNMDPLTPLPYNTNTLTKKRSLSSVLSRPKSWQLGKHNSKSSIRTAGHYRTFSYGAISDVDLEHSLSIHDIDEEEEDFEHEVVTVESELKTFIKNTIPLIITFCLSQSYTILCTVTASKVFGTDELSAVSLASMTATITFSIFEGISTALDVLNSQAYGLGNLKKVGLYTQRSIVLSMVMFIPFAILWWKSDCLFRHILETDRLVYLTSSFLRTLILAAPAYIIFENTKRFLQCQGIFNASTLVLFISTPLSIFSIRVLVDFIGFQGIAITCVLNFWIMAILIICYVAVIDGQDCWDGFKWEAFEGWLELLKFGFAGIVCTFLEASSWEILTLISSFFGTEALAAQSAISTIASLTFFVPFASGISSSTRVANFVGAGRIDGPAQIATKIGLYAALFAGSFNACTLYFGRHFIAHLYSNDPKVISLIIQILPLVSLIQIFDALNTVSGSLLRGQGSPFIGGIINFIVYDFFAIPLALILSYHLKMELTGLWIGIGAGLLIIGITETYYVLRVDWEDAVQKCLERNRIKI